MVVAYSVKQVSMNLHKACRNRSYSVPGGENVRRALVPESKVSWLEAWPTYKPPSYTLPGLSSQPWADPDIGSPGFNPKWNKLDEGVHRESLVRLYDVRKSYPLNPCGRTGLRGRGRLGRWGPNHAVDAIVSRWKRSVLNEKIVSTESNCPVLQFLSIQRKDTGEWAIPGGMIDEGESHEEAVRREFLEEALNSPNVEEFLSTEVGVKIKEFFAQGKIVFKGYVDDPRNTDNAWMETTAFLFHDEDESTVSLLEIKAGDDASKVQWKDISRELKLYASHADIIEDVAGQLEAHW